MISFRAWWAVYVCFVWTCRTECEDRLAETRKGVKEGVSARHGWSTMSYSRESKRNLDRIVLLVVAGRGTRLSPVGVVKDNNNTNEEKNEGRQSEKRSNSGVVIDCQEAQNLKKEGPRGCQPSVGRSVERRRRRRSTTRTRAGGCRAISPQAQIN